MEIKDTEIGRMPLDWDVKTVAEVVEYVTDYVANGSFKSLADNVKYYSEKNFAVLIRLKDYNDNFNEAGFVYIDEHGYNFLEKSKLFGGEVIISNVGDVGTVFKCPFLGCPMSLGPNSVTVKFKQSDDFYYYWFKSHYGQKAIKSIITGSAQPKFNKTNFKQLKVPVPPIHIQERIGKILSCFDEKISLNKQTISILSETISTIFKGFVPSYSKTKVSINDLILDSCTGADAIQKAPIVDRDTGIRCVRVGDMTNNRPVYEWGFTDITQENFERYKLIKNDLVVTRTATLGISRLIDEDLEAVLNNGLIRLRPNTNKIIPLILFQQLQTTDFKRYIERINSESSTRPNMKMNYLLSYEFLCFDKRDQQKLFELINPLYCQVNNLFDENRSISLLRDSVCSKLMSGELDVDKIKIED